MCTAEKFGRIAGKENDTGLPTALRSSSFELEVGDSMNAAASPRGTTHGGGRAQSLRETLRCVVDAAMGGERRAELRAERSRHQPAELSVRPRNQTKKEPTTKER